MSIELLARGEIRNLTPYETARQVAGTVRLNANEAPWPIDGRHGDGLNRYPEIRPVELHARLAAHYAVSIGRVLATRGSSEAIDLLIRAFCRAGADSIAVSSPTFSMYRVYADIQGARTISIALCVERDFALDAALVLENCTPDTKLLFVCSPNNPTGGLVPLASIRELAEARRGRSVIVVDEAYGEYSEAPSAVTLLEEHENIVVLRTLSKARSLAGARCGVVLAHEGLISLLNRILAPYALATPVIDCVLRSLSEENLQRSRKAVQRVLAERERVAGELHRCAEVVRVWPSRSNFNLVQFRDLAFVESRLREAGILIRAFDHEPSLRNCARISVGTPAENDLLLGVLGHARRSA